MTLCEKQCEWSELTSMRVLFNYWNPASARRLPCSETECLRCLVFTCTWPQITCWHIHVYVNLSLKRMVLLFSFPLRNGKMVLLTQVYMSVSKEPGAIWGCYCTALSSIPLVMENLWPKFFFMKNTVMVKNWFELVTVTTFTCM